MGARNVTELAAFRLCEELAKAIEAATAIGRVASDFKFCGQINDAALDAVSDVAEGFARYYPREFARFLDFAISSLEEVHRRTEAGYRRGHFDSETTSNLLQLRARADKATRGLRAYLWSVKKDDLPPRPSRSHVASRKKRKTAKRAATATPARSMSKAPGHEPK